MNNKISGKAALITGASSGFGEAMARSFAGAGVSVILVARNADKLNRVADDINSNGGTAVPLPGDVNNPDLFAQALCIAIERFARLDILINNAGGGIKIAPVEDQTMETVTSCVELNLLSVINACRIIIPHLKMQRSGLIINVTSACEKFAWPGWSVYSAAKAGLSMFSRCLYTELRPFGIGVTALVPGASNTGFLDAAGLSVSPDAEPMSLLPEHMAHAAFSIVEMPSGAVVPEMVVYGMSQEIIPF